ncbi:hypothetical protein RclHR1_29360001 [Rhizophagus clarus]|uniref:BAH domain-containing protein n=1 Tax=Rhizophagus clarus TaxID=94130 RepID=A0A2Z6RKG2_9GLOM|nr:hypothetical protein RclHR1_29360001 [Rhizophagus clarus]
MKAVFSSEFTTGSYQSLQKCLQDELIILPKVFANFINLPNLHINMHLLMHAQTFGTFNNTQVGIKEMVHRIFKGIVPSTNHKDIDLDLIKRYNTLFAIQHLSDDAIDPRFTKPCASFTSLVTSPVEFISNISLKKGMSKKNRDNLLQNILNFKSELSESYKDMRLGDAALIYSNSISWYEFTSYTIEEENSTFAKVTLYLNDFIMINDEDFNKSYTIIRGIFKHKGNNEKYYAFIVIDWFEDNNQEYPVLECPLYYLQTIENQRWRSIFPISAIDSVNRVLHRSD